MTVRTDAGDEKQSTGSETFMENGHQTKQEQSLDGGEQNNITTIMLTWGSKLRNRQI
jgi:hypothetical protein